MTKETDNITKDIELGKNMKHTVILSNVSHEFTEPITLQNKICGRVNNVNLKIFPMKQYRDFKTFQGDR